MNLTKQNLLFSFIASCLFIAHPIHTEVVANIKSRDEILALLMSIASLNYFISYLRKSDTLTLILSLAFYIIGLLSKESSITFLAIFPLAGWYFTDAKRGSILKGMAFMAGAALLFLLIRNAILTGSTPESVSVADNLLMAANSQASKFATAVYILGLYLKLLIFPHPLVFDYSYNQIPIIELTNIKFILSALVYISLLAYAFLTIKKKTFLSFCIFYFLITLSIYSNIFIIIGSSMGERFLYGPSLGYSMAIAWLLTLLIKEQNLLKGKNLIDQLNYNTPLIAIFIAVVLGYSFKTVTRNPVWENNYTLYSNDVLLSPNSTRTHYYLGNYLVKPEAFEGKSEEEKNKTLMLGIQELQKSIDIYPSFSDAHLQMGVAYYKLQNLDSALVCYNRALKINPKYPSIYNNIGTIYFSKQQYSEALNYFTEAVRLDNSYAEAHMNLGSTYGMIQQYDKALSSLFSAIKYDPNLAQAYYFIGITYRIKGDEMNANSYLEKSYRLNPELRPKN